MNEEEVQYAGFWIRFLAFLIDSTVATIAIAPLVVTLIGETVVTDYNLEDPGEITMLLQRMSLQLGMDMLFMGTVFILFWIFFSATPGKMLFKTSIVDARSFGKATPGQDIIRYLGYFVSLIPFGLGFLWIAFDGKKQGWHDKMARTVVIKGKPRETPQGQI